MRHLKSCCYITSKQKHSFYHKIILTVLARHGAVHIDQVSVRVDSHDEQVLSGGVLTAHASRHFLVFEHSSGVLTHTRGAHSTVVQRVTVRGITCCYYIV